MKLPSLLEAKKRTNNKINIVPEGYVLNENYKNLGLGKFTNEFLLFLNKSAVLLYVSVLLLIETKLLNAVLIIVSYNY